MSLEPQGPWEGKTKCLIAFSRWMAETLIERIGLDQGDWAPRAYFDSAMGKKWDTIVIVSPPHGGWQNCHHDWINVALRTKTDNLVIL